MDSRLSTIIERVKEIPDVTIGDLRGETYFLKGSTLILTETEQNQIYFKTVEGVLTILTDPQQLKKPMSKILSALLEAKPAPIGFEIKPSNLSSFPVREVLRTFKRAAETHSTPAPFLEKIRVVDFFIVPVFQPSKDIISIAYERLVNSLVSSALWKIHNIRERALSWSQTLIANVNYSYLEARARAINSFLELAAKFESSRLVTLRVFDIPPAVLRWRPTPVGIRINSGKDYYIFFDLNFKEQPKINVEIETIRSDLNESAREVFTAVITPFKRSQPQSALLIEEERSRISVEGLPFDVALLEEEVRNALVASVL